MLRRRTSTLGPILFDGDAGGTGGTGGTDGGTGEGGTSTTDGGTTTTTTGISQDEVKRIAAREKAEGKRAAEKALADQLGVPVSEAAEIIKAHREREAAEKSEVDRVKGEATSEKAKREAAERDLAETRHALNVERALLKAGVPVNRVERAVRLVDAEVGATPEELEASITALKADVPEFFPATEGAGDDGAEGGGKGGAPNSDPAGTPRKVAGRNADAFKRGQERAKALTQGQDLKIETVG